LLKENSIKLLDLQKKMQTKLLELTAMWIYAIKNLDYIEKFMEIRMLTVTYKGVTGTI